MGIFLKITGVIVIAIGIIFCVTVIGLPAGLSMITQGVTLYAIGAIYDDVKRIKTVLPLDKESKAISK